MKRNSTDTDQAFAGSGETIRSAIQRIVMTRTRCWLIAVTLLAGLAAGVMTTAGVPAADLTFAILSEPVQSLMSVTVPFLGVLLVGDLRRTVGPAWIMPSLLAAILLAAAIGLFGVLVSAVALAITSPGSAPGPWLNAGTIAVGGVLVQIVAQLVGTGLGLLLRSPVVASLATIVLPLGLWLVLGGVEILRPAQAWLTPYSSVRNLLSGQMSVMTWTQWLAVVLIWCVGLNVMGAVRLKRSRSGHALASEGSHDSER
ncbi:hypothetical protein HII36_11315 [Nonomuraea sp. NN258]|uniref:hypothetical protein n=1 Tax=Nonomuraea antri TaxID=2730852 RepID=UPI0015698BC8|nr:hypothetical protein [Nonomuraea antri]NRQ32423.1 hypothetical protein [Nonomuraea antri]